MIQVPACPGRGDSPQAMFAIVQGALYPDLRRESADGLTQLPFDGFAIGGLAVGEGKSEREDTCEIAAAMLPADKPRYLMGVGTPDDIVAKLSAATAKVIADPDFQRILATSGLEGRADSAAPAAKAFWQSERQRLTPVMTAAGLTPS